MIGFSNYRGLPFLLTVVCLACGFSMMACASQDSESGDNGREVFDVRGRLVETVYEGEAALIDHGEIPDYMHAMRMAFRVRDPEELKGVQPGDSLRFEYVVESATRSWIRNIEVIR